MLRQLAIGVLVSGAVAASACGAQEARPFGATSRATTLNDAGLSAEDPTDWAYLYDHYFGPETPGHCGNADCHLEQAGTFLCGEDKDTCYTGLIAAGLVNVDNPIASRLGNPQTSPLSWFGLGPMPYDNPTPNEEAARAVTRWLESGARNRGTAQVNGLPLTSDGSIPDAGSDAKKRRATGDIEIPVETPTWTYLYSYYFGPNTPGHCGACHIDNEPGFSCRSKRDCYDSLLATGLVNTASAGASRLGSVSESPLSWLGGDEPRDNPLANPRGAALVRAWLRAGAKYD